MSNRRDDISLIRRYLNGELDTRAMHRLERTAQDDPFLMDALDGYHIRTDQQANLEDLANKLHSRVHRFQRKTLVLWPLIGAVASVLGFVIVGAWWIMVYMPAANKGARPATDRTVAISKPLQARPGPLKPQSQSLAGVAVDTARKDTAVKKQGNAGKLTVTPQPQKKHDPVKGSVEASTVIADLNKQPYSIAKHKADIASTQQNGTDQLAVVKQKQAVKGSELAIIPSNKNNITVSAAKPLANPNKPLSLAGNANANNAVSASKSVTEKSKPITLADNAKNNTIILPGKLPASTAKIIPPPGIINNTMASQNKTAASPTFKTADGARATGALKTKADTQKNNALAEVVVVGYATQRKKDIAVSREDIKLQPIDPNLSYTSARVNPNVVLKSNEIPTITGQVVASDDGKPIPGVALRIMGTQTGTVTDANGRFSIRMAKNQSLQANFIGYFGKQVTPTGTDVKIVMQPVNYALNEVVVTTPDKKTNKAAATDSKANLNVTDAKVTANPNVAENKNNPNLNITDNKTANNPKTTGINNAVAKINSNPVMHVNGRVLAFATNYPIPAVVMWNKNADVQYRLENDGIFDLVVHKGDDIYVGHTGFKTQKVKIKNKTHFDIVLEENNSTLFDGFVKGLTFTPYDDTAHPSMGWGKFKPLQNIKSADGKTGTVKVEFTINANNSVSNIKVTKSVSASADSAAVRIIREQTKWVHNTNNQPENVSVKFKVQ